MTIFGIRNYAKDILEIRRPPTELERGLGQDVDDLCLDGSSYAPDQRRETERDRERKRYSQSTFLRINLWICNATVWIMFVVAVVECAFASMMQDDLKNDEMDPAGKYWIECTNYYVYQPFPDFGEEWKDTTKQCDMLLSWTYIMIVAGSFSLFRTLMNGLPVHAPNHMTIQYRPGGKRDSFLTPSRAYAIRTFFSAGALVFHLPSAIMLGVSPVVRRPAAAEEYRIMYILCLSLVCLSTTFVAHQTFVTGLASWRMRNMRATREQQGTSSDREDE
ncbi:hypothetical protein LIA77_11509 [Sarocladium implicatum]|nr:hypothetical protein LIA77_11509 [Sarocladium implicatum]